MNIRPAISVPLPWVIALLGRIYGKKKPGASSRRPVFRLPRSLSFTKEGKWFIGVLFLIGIAAINTGNNLLYLIVATLLSLITVSGIMSESTLRGVRVIRELPREVFKGSPAIARLAVVNGKRFLPSFSFSVSELPEDGVRSAPAYILKAGPGEEVLRTSVYTFARRGRFNLSGLRVSTRFPFGLFLKGKVEDSTVEVIVFPSIKATKKTQALLKGEKSGDLMGAKGDGTTIYGLRDYAAGDDARYIHWVSAAKAGRLVVKEFEEESVKKVFVVFENRSTGDAEAFEEAVDEAAAAVNAFIEKGCSVGLKTLSAEVRPGRGADQLLRILNTLALIKPSGEKGTPAVRVVSRI